VLIVGRAGGPEERLVPMAGFDLATVPIRGLDRDAVWKNLALPYLLPMALVRGLDIVRRFQPDVVLGVGGYAMVPAVAAARLRGVPYVLHEKDVRPGMATRFFAGGAAAICTTLPGTDVRLGRRAVLTGLPLREGFAPRIPSVPPRTLLVTGGSQGARRINQAVWRGLDGLLSRFREVIHLAGRQGAEELLKRRRPGYRGLAFSEDMAALMQEADLIVCRAGVGTIGEFTAVGLPAILIPGAFGDRHQELNAQAVVDAGAAVSILDAEVTPGRLLEAIDELDDERLRRMARASAGLGRRDAAERVVTVLTRVAAR
jgi:UDP-N-acetylglucosamine--N-acetylmuramyl-(pentapeptide) pyrophosphoryl-undecaprenol N-acetylglucosamine transferase